jgi:hypothetical protein
MRRLRVKTLSLTLSCPRSVLAALSAAPLMFVSAQMVTVALTSDQINTIVSDSTRISAGFGWIAAVVCIILFLYNGRTKLPRHKLLLTLVIWQCIYTAGLQWCVASLDVGMAADFRFRLVMGSQFAVWIWVALLGVNEVVRKYHGTRAEQVLYKWYNVVGLTLIVTLIACLELFASHPFPMADLEFCACWFRYGQPQYWVIMMLLATCISATLLALMTARGDAGLDPTSSSDTQPHIGLDLTTHLLGQDVEQSFYSEDSIAEPSMLAPASGGGPHSRSPEASMGPRSAPSTFSSHDSLRPVSPSLSEAGSPVVTASSGGRENGRRSVPVGADGSNGVISGTNGSVLTIPPRRSARAAITAFAEETIWLSAIKLLLMLMFTSMLLTMSLYAWSRDKNGIRVEMQLLDAVLFALSAVIVLGLFGATKTMRSPLRPLKRWLKKKFKRNKQ